MVREEQFNDQPPHLAQVRRVGPDDHARRRRVRARRHGPAAALHLHEAQSAGAGRLKAEGGVVAQVRDVDAQPTGRMENGRARRDRNHPAIDGKRYLTGHRVVLLYAARAAAKRSHRRHRRASAQAARRAYPLVTSSKSPMRFRGDRVRMVRRRAASGDSSGSGLPGAAHPWSGGSSPLPPRKRSIASAARWPAAIASMIVAGPVTAPVSMPTPSSLPGRRSRRRPPRRPPRRPCASSRCPPRGARAT